MRKVLNFIDFRMLQDRSAMTTVTAAAEKLRKYACLTFRGIHSANTNKASYEYYKKANSAHDLAACTK